VKTSLRFSFVLNLYKRLITARIVKTALEKAVLPTFKKHTYFHRIKLRFSPYLVKTQPVQEIRLLRFYSVKSAINAGRFEIKKQRSLLIEFYNDFIVWNWHLTAKFHNRNMEDFWRLKSTTPC